MNKMQGIKNHFDEEAHIFDELILKLIPFYQEMIEALVLAIPFEKSQHIKVLDLGCGTGTISESIQKKFPNAEFTIVDIAKNMLEIAQNKIKSKKTVISHNADFYNYKFKEKFDVIISSLALHHLVTDQDKINFYNKIYQALNPNGIFLNADVVLASNSHLQDQYMQKWIDYLTRSCTKEEIDKCLANYKKEDSPATLMNHIKWLEKIGFQDVDIIWKYYNFAVYGGRK